MASSDMSSAVVDAMVRNLEWLSAEAASRTVRLALLREENRRARQGQAARAATSPLAPAAAQTPCAPPDSTPFGPAS
jgi:hypothetical protein